MFRINRREFLGHSAAVLGTSALGGRVLAAVAEGKDSIAIQIGYVGTPPERKVLDCSSDPICARMYRKKPLLDESLVVGETGGLQNVFVYIDKGLPDKKWAVPNEPVVLSENCRFYPHVFGVMADQPLKIVNASKTLEVPHLLPRINKEQSFKSPPGASKTIKLPHPEMGIRVTCDVHPWELAFCHVLPHPFYATTDAQGQCTIKSLEPGEYRLAFWHEKLGTMIKPVKVEQGKTLKLLDLTSKQIKKRKRGRKPKTTSPSQPA